MKKFGFWKLKLKKLNVSFNSNLSFTDASSSYITKSTSIFVYGLSGTIIKIITILSVIEDNVLVELGLYEKNAIDRIGA
jgi:hypothetical protein